MVIPEPENRAAEHLRTARAHAAYVGRCATPELDAHHAQLGTMHYLGYLAETKWSEDPYNDGRQP